MAATATKTDEVLASARRELEAQLDLVRGELSRLAAEERALTRALSSLDGGSSSAATDAGTGKRSRAATTKRSRRKAASARGRRRGASKSTADRVEELRGLLAAGPRSRADLAAALKVSPARVQQLLSELGGSVSSRPDPNQRRGKLWMLTGAGTEGSSGARSGASAKGNSTRKPAARRRQAAK